MSLFLVSYDLRARKDYPELWDAIAELDGFKVLDSVYLLALEDRTTANQVLEHLRTFIDDDDGMVVIEFEKKPAAFKCKPGTAKWLRDHFG
jgi:hypothetical protein